MAVGIRTSTAVRRSAFWIAAVGFVLVWALPRLFMPLATDQAYFALGARTILEGDQLYRDFWDLKPPLIYLLYSLPAAVLGESTEAYRLLDFANTVLAMAGVFALTRRFFSERAAFAAAIVYGFSYVTMAGFGGLGQSESFMVAPLAFGLAVYPGPQDRYRNVRALLAGLLLGAAIAVKFPAAAFFPAFLALEWCLSDSRRFDWRGTALRTVIAGAGVLLAQALWLLYLLQAGTLGDFIEIQREYTQPYTDLRWAPEQFGYARFLIQATADWFRGNAYLVVPAWLGLLLLFHRGMSRDLAFFASLLALGVLSVWWQGKLFVYHWLIMLPLLAPLAGHAADWTLGFMERVEPGRRWALAGILVVGLIGLASAAWLSTYDSYRYMLSYVAGSISRHELDYEYLGQLRQNRELVAYIEAHSGEDEGVYVWGFWTAPYLWVDRPSPSRFLTNAPVRATWSPQEWRDELVDDLAAEPPRFFAVAAGDRQPWLNGSDQTSDAYFCTNYPELRRFVDANYQPVFRNELFVVYDRDAPEATVSTWCDAETSS